MPRYIAIEGVIGVGKTTLARLLQPRFEASILLEVFEENPFLAKFYGDRERHAFQTQLFFLLSRYHQQHKAIPAALAKGTLISDYTFAKDELFAWLNLKDDELAMYGRVHAALGEKIPKPDLIVYLRANHDVTMRRITLRDRPYERDMDPEYIRGLAVAYDNWLSNLQEPPVLTIDTTELDFLAREDDLNHVTNLIKAALAQQAPAQPKLPFSDQLENGGGLAAFQQFQLALDADKGFDPDLFFNYILLTGEMGEIATELKQIWWERNRQMADGRTADDAIEAAIGKRQQSLADELADVLAYTLKLANYTGIDLEAAYRAKMQKNLGREWPNRAGM